jgi:hypothetical protein
MMVTAIGVLLVLLVLFGVFLFFARRILRLALKLAFVGAIVFSLFGGAILGWWRGWFSPSSKGDGVTIQSPQRANSNRRRQ